MDEKYCSGCKENVPITDFGINRAKKDNLQSRCRKCRVLDNKKYYINTPDLNDNRKRLKRKHIVDKIIKPLKEQGCCDCKGKFNMSVMEFDHIKGEKSFSIGNAYRMGKDIKEMIHLLSLELEKCVVRCANCHLKRTIRASRTTYNRIKYLDRDFEVLNEKHILVYSLLSNSKCVDCEEDDFLLLELDHVRDSKKESLSRMLSRNEFSLQEVKEEIKKCDIRCRNCHRMQTILRPLSTWRRTSSKRKVNKIDWPETEDLIKMISSYGYLRTGKRLGVSDNGVRKHLISQGVDVSNLTKTPECQYDN